MEVEPKPTELTAYFNTRHSHEFDASKLDSITKDACNDTAKNFKSYVKNKPFEFKFENTKSNFFSCRTKSHLPPVNYLSKVKYVNSLNKNMKNLQLKK